MSSPGEHDDVTAVDPFDLPDWLGTAEVVWTAASPLAERHLVEGELRGGDQALGCDLLAVDQAWPRPVVGEEWRHAAHGEWVRGELLLLRVGGRLTLVAPGTSVDAGRALEMLGRLARAVGVSPSHFLVALRP
ncbi:MAG TPA: hypothetical protein VFM09_04405 [Marmoricola sp.]|nr:hypothetical protein [Marmoricola sp.]